MSSRIWIRKVLVNNSTLAVSTLVCALFFISHSAYAQDEKEFDPEEAFYKASRYYEAGDYDKAASEYKRILKIGLKSGKVYYNLGNCCLKNNHLGPAILNYEKAKLFMPRDGALLANYRYAVSLIKQRSPNSKGPAFLQRAYRAFDFLTMREAMFLFGLVYYGFALCLVLSKFIKNFRLLSKLASLLLLCLAVITVVPLSNKVREAGSSAVVVSPIADAKLEPLDDASSSFPLYEGMKVYVLKSGKTGWYKVKRSDGKIGWLKEGNAELISG